ncbi:large exoprotein [Microbacterium sp. gxy059]|uniref:large exoprotein n=1 Tax=Microbacterium sp. gxy059 TaxID=2957199 RepID=UPI003D969B02
MGGQVLGGGAIALVVAVLWLAYLLPSWHAKMRYAAAERNAVRLNQALRVLAETAEVPEELRVELTRRDANRQRRIVKRMQEEDERLREADERLALAKKRREVEEERLRRLADLEEERRRIATLRADPLRRQAGARRRVRVASLVIALAGLAATIGGLWLLAATGIWALAIGGAVATATGLGLLRRMAVVSTRSAAPVSAPQAVRPQQRAARPAPALLNPEDRGWTPRRLPAPLTAMSGSRASEEIAGATAQERLRQLAREEGARVQLEREQAASAPVPIETARPKQAPAAEGAESGFSAMGYVDDDAIERHVRELLARRAAG